MAFNPPQINNLVNRKTFRNPSTQIALYALIIILFSWFVLRPAIATWNERRTALKAETNKYNKIDGERSALNTLIADLQDKEGDIKLLDEAVPLNQEIAKLYILLENFVSASGLQTAQIGADISEIGIQAADKTELQNRFGTTRSIKTVPVTVSINGNIDQLKNLLQLIETNGRVLDIEKVEMTKGQETTNFLIQLKAYAYDTTSDEIK